LPLFSIAPSLLHSCSLSVLVSALSSPLFRTHFLS
jgi:hypothetical protein